MNTHSKLIIVLCAMICQKATFGQAPDWKHSTKWTIYNTGGAKFYKVKVDSLGLYPSRPLNTDSMQEFLQNATALPVDNPPVWLGAFVASCVIDGRQSKIDISRYSDFFFDETDQKYYQIPRALQKDWLAYLKACASALAATK